LTTSTFSTTRRDLSASPSSRLPFLRLRRLRQSLLRSATSATFNFQIKLTLRACAAFPVSNFARCLTRHHKGMERYCTSPFPCTQDSFARVPMRGYHSVLHCAMVKNLIYHKFASRKSSCRNPGHLKFVWHQPRRPVFAPQLPRIPVSKLGPHCRLPTERPHYSRH
jgi:hypothetical protein